jgi:hypothetical protein
VVDERNEAGVATTACNMRRAAKSEPTVVEIKPVAAGSWVNGRWVPAAADESLAGWKSRVEGFGRHHCGRQVRRWPVGPIGGCVVTVLTDPARPAPAPRRRAENRKISESLSFPALDSAKLAESALRRGR